MTTLVASNLEIIVAQWLDKKGIYYEFQTSMMGGHYSLGGSVIDFLFPDRGLAWRIQGEYYHKGVVKEGTDEIQKELLSTLGYTVVDIWGEDLLDPGKVNETLTKALMGQEMLR